MEYNHLKIFLAVLWTVLLSVAKCGEYSKVLYAVNFTHPDKKTFIWPQTLDAKDVVVRANKSFKLYCEIDVASTDAENDSPIVWTSYPAHLKNNSRLAANFSTLATKSNRKTKWRSTLIVQSSEINDSGVYRCERKTAAQTGISDQAGRPSDDNQVIKTFGVFVFDGENLLTSTRLSVVAWEGSRAVIPWRLTLKTATVELRRSSPVVHPYEHASFEASLGLVVSNVSAKDQGVWECIARSGNITTTRMAILTVMKRAPPKIASIEFFAEPPSRIVLVNETFRLRCEVERELRSRVQINILGERLKNITTQCGGNENEHRQKAKKGYKFVSCQITIQRAALSDSGKYHCKVWGRGLMRNKSLELKVVEDEPYLEFADCFECIPGNHTLKKVQVTRENKGVVSFKFRSFPELVDFTTFHDGLPLNEHVNVNSTCHTRQNKVGGDVIFSIAFDHVRDEDDGIYSVIADNGHITLNVTFYVVVGNPMKPRLISDPEWEKKTKSVMVGRDVKLECKATGGPTPLVSWYHGHGQKPIANGTTYLLPRAAKKDEGNYTCVARNKLGQDFRSIQLHVEDLSQDITVGFSTGFVILLICLVILGTMLAKKILHIQEVKRKMENHQRFLVPILDPNEFSAEEQAERLSYDPKKWEIPRDRLRLGKTIGRGAFGRVVQATAFDVDKSSPCKTVAVKMLKAGSRSSEYQALTSELKILIHIGPHLNIVNLFGASTTKDGPLMIVVEYCRHGNLSNYLRKMRPHYIGQVRKKGAENKGDETDLESRDRKRSATDESDAADSASVSEESAFVDCGDEGRSPCRWSDGRKRRSTSSSLSSGSNSVVSHDNDEVLLRAKTRLSSSCSVASGQESLKNSNAGDEDKDPDEKTALSEADLLSYSLQVARGMEFLSSKMCIHRDLAARNILLSDYQVVKICDFGLARDVYKDNDYVRSGEARLPLKWMALESIFDKVYSTKSDIWSFGVLLGEIFSLGGSPYPGIQMDEDFCNKLKRGVRMKQPEHAPEQVYSAMLACWANKPEERPTFTKLAEEFSDILQSECANEYLDMLKIFQQSQEKLERGVNPVQKPTETFDEAIATKLDEQRALITAVEYTDIDGKCSAVVKMARDCERGSSVAMSITDQNQNMPGTSTVQTENENLTVPYRTPNHDMLGTETTSCPSLFIAGSSTPTCESPPSYSMVVERIE